jgi:hypothetical protein
MSLPYDLKVLLEMFTYRRPHGGSTVDEFVRDFILPYKPLICHDSSNYIIDIGENFKTVFSSHVDTVHKDDGKQKIVYDSINELVFKEDGHPLGADDATGVWLMLQMIDNKVPGRYIFHVGEECGGIGSGNLATYAAHHLDNISHAVAFDRRGTTDVITHQGWSRCCSDSFASELAHQLKLNYRPDDGGVFTDTANYTGLVNECTNLSVGYENEHTGSETQDIRHLMQLRDALLRVDWSSLPDKRDKTAVEFDDFDFNYTPAEDYVYMSASEIYEFIENYPDAVAQILEDRCVSLVEMREYINDFYGSEVLRGRK